ncbi:putative ABC transporter [Nostocoides japonicum T1-X7]|uniref:Putative ABC transporter n=1 Tax=Nostocoides japonicum T1-X7 TaxID=1194083 RepID=A0A077M6X7_9MICO|nr:thiol reductant ABC exporter subunit CydD [Tetrasphaera japonica]CCH79795.1 putative ABC transporter [Tetrasphaera japonica T1-X7]
MRPFDPRLAATVPSVRRPVAVLAAVGVAAGMATIATAFALAAVVVEVVRDRALDPAAWWLLGLFAVRGALGWVAERVAAWAGVEVSTRLRDALLAGWARRPVDARPPADRALTLAAQGCSAVEPYAARFLPALVSAAVVPTLAVACLWVVDWRSALAVTLTLPLLPLFAALIGRTTQEDTDRRWRALATLSGHFLDVMRGLPTLVTYNRAERQAATIRQVSERHRRATMRTLRLAFLSSAALELLATISVAIVAVLVGLRLTTGGIDLGTGLLAILLAPEAYWPIRRVGAEFHSAADGAAAVDDVLAELGRPVPDSGRTPGPAVHARGLSYRYPGSDRLVLAGVDLDAGPGITVLTGPSGIGKTTLLELVAGLRVPTAGTLEAPACHLVTQRPFLAAGSVRDNLTLGNAAPDDLVWAALRDVGLDGVVAALPRALDTRLGDDGFGLSAGQRARLAIARARLSDAPAVLLDEPTAHLDPVSAERVHGIVRDLATTRVVLVVTHRPELVAVADDHVDLAAVAERSGVTR